MPQLTDHPSNPFDLHLGSEGISRVTYDGYAVGFIAEASGIKAFGHTREQARRRLAEKQTRIRFNNALAAQNAPPPTRKGRSGR